MNLLIYYSSEHFTLIYKRSMYEIMGIQSIHETFTYPGIKQS